MRSRELLEALVTQCLEQGLFVQGTAPGPDADLVETGQIDSMGLVQLQALVEEGFGVLIPAAVFVAELRTLGRIAAYLDVVRARLARSLASE